MKRANGVSLQEDLLRQARWAAPRSKEDVLFREAAAALDELEATVAELEATLASQPLSGGSLEEQFTRLLATAEVKLLPWQRKRLEVVYEKNVFE